jgi:hypothetical protein
MKRLQVPTFNISYADRDGNIEYIFNGVAPKRKSGDNAFWRGLVPGDRVASLMPNRGELLVHYLACLKAGLVATPLNSRYQGPEIDHALEVSGASLLVAHAERDDVLAASAQVPRLVWGISYAVEVARGRLKSDLMVETDLTPPRPAAAFIFTSGKPKGDAFHESFGWMVASRIAGLALTPGDVPAGHRHHTQPRRCPPGWGLCRRAVLRRTEVPPCSGRDLRCSACRGPFRPGATTTRRDGFPIFVAVSRHKIASRTEFRA